MNVTTKQLLITSLAATLVAMSSALQALDTDIYLKPPALNRDDSPNVLLVIGNSNAMEATLTARPKYDPTQNYCAIGTPVTAPAGKTNQVCNGTTPYANRIFWTYSDLAKLTSADAASTQWFDSSKNKCLDPQATLSTSGVYSTSKKIARYCSSATCGYPNSKNSNFWTTLSTSTNAQIDYVDCEADNPTTANTVADGLAANDSMAPADEKLIGNAYGTTVNKWWSWATYNEASAPKLVTAHYMAYLLNTGIGVTQSYLDVVKTAVNSAIDANRDVRLGLMVFNENEKDCPAGAQCNGGRILMPVDTMTDARRADMKAIVNQLCGTKACKLKVDGISYGPDLSSGVNYSPLAETLWEAYQYLGGLAVDYGDDWAAAAPPRDKAAEDGAGNYLTPFKYGCQKAYVILITGSDPTNDADADKKIMSLPGVASCAGYDGTDPTTAGTQASGSCLKDLAKYIYANDVVPESVLAGFQNVVTYTIGFGPKPGDDTTYPNGLSANGVKLLTTAAENGGGTFKQATNGLEIIGNLQSAITSALMKNTSFSSPSLSVNAFNRLYNRDEIYFALFKPSTTARWDGNIKKYHLCNTSDVKAYGCTFGDVMDAGNAIALDGNSKIKDQARSFWSSTADGAEVTAGGAGSKVPVPSSRKVYTVWDYSILPATAIEITPTVGNTVYDTAINDPTIFGLTDTEGTTTATNAVDTAAVTSLFNWLHGDKDGDMSTRDLWVLSDPLHSRPVAVTYGGTSASPIIKLFVGSNDGSVRMIDDVSGAEQWAFIPKELFALQNDLKLDADTAHIIGMDSTPTFWVQDINNDGIIDPATDKVYMYIGMRRGGRTSAGVDLPANNIYAFDITPASTLTSSSSTFVPKLMWVISGGTGDFAKLAQTWSRPLVTKILVKCNGTGCAVGDASRKTVLIFAGGYNIGQDNGVVPSTDATGNAIYIVDAVTGQRIWWMSNAGATYNHAAMTYSIPSDVALLDSNADGAVDRLYVGDMGGQIWRINLGNQIDVNANGGSDAMVFADLGCKGDTRINGCTATAMQDRIKFFYPPDISQVKDPNFSTNALYDLVSIGSGNREDPLDLLTTNASGGPFEPVHNRIYALRDYSYGLGASPTSTLTEADLYDASANLLSDTASAGYAAEKNKLMASYGWFINLTEQNKVILPNGLATTWIGEKVLARTSIFGGTLFATTYIPANDVTVLKTCAPTEGEGRLYAMNFLTGVGTTDFNKDKILDRSKVVGGGIPSETVIVIREGGTTGLVGTSGGAAGTGTTFNNQPQRTYWYDE